MHAQCDPKGSQYFLFDSIVDYRRSTTSLAQADQKVVKANDKIFSRRSIKRADSFLCSGKMTVSLGTSEIGICVNWHLSALTLTR